MENLHSVLIVAVIVIVTALTRFLPFIIFSGKRKTPEFVLYLGRVLPYAIMGMLVVYCLKDVSFIREPFGIPEIIAGVFVAGVHIWKKNSLLSIGLGTALYMALVQFVFR